MKVMMVVAMIVVVVVVVVDDDDHGCGGPLVTGTVVCPSRASR